MITKLKYVGVNTDDLLDIYILFIRSVVEYCAVVFHSSVTQKQSEELEKNSEDEFKIYTWRHLFGISSSRGDVRTPDIL